MVTPWCASLANTPGAATLPVRMSGLAPQMRRSEELATMLSVQDSDPRAAARPGRVWQLITLLVFAFVIFAIIHGDHGDCASRFCAF